jgi:hypothetical protein
MSGAQASGTATAGEETTRRRKPNRPPTVPLSEFGKAPPPPPRVRLTPRQIVTYTASGLVLVLCIWFASVWIGQRSDQIWSGAGALDQRNR